MPPINPQLESPLFSQLLPEIRTKIYEFYLDDLRQLTPLESVPVRYWSFSKRPELAFVAKWWSAYGGKPDLLRTCKRICTELVPSVFDHFSISALQIGCSVRSGVGVFGRLDIAHKRKLTIINHHPTSMHDWLSLFRGLTSYESAQHCGCLLDYERQGGDWEKLDMKRVGKEPIPIATKLEELVLDWYQKPYWDRFRAEIAEDPEFSEGDGQRLEKQMREDEREKLLFSIARLETLKVIKLRGDYPAWWVDFLRENCASKPRVIRE